ncbi:MAG: helix-turn-helix domain-containing protein [Ruminococcaceae bacterium]|nr:helix-turn-helix domain-containing protein [Oscillospiraceae bacterium]
MSRAIGELLLENGVPLLKMWTIDVDLKQRPYVKHSHTRFEITVVNGGSGVYTTESAVYPMEEGDVFVFSSNEIHCITETDGELSITNLHFEPRYLSDDFSNSYVNFCFYHSPEFSNRILSDRAETLRFHHNTIKEELLGGESNYSVAVKAHLDLMLIDLLRNHSYLSVADKKNSSQDILNVCNFIDKHLDEELTLKGLSDIAGLSPNYFSHIFKEMNGISLWDYITVKRVEKAVHLIRTSGRGTTMLDIALLCGFNNTVNFNKAFKKYKGITPGELKRCPDILSH